MTLNLIDFCFICVRSQEESLEQWRSERLVELSHMCKCAHSGKAELAMHFPCSALSYVADRTAFTHSRDRTEEGMPILIQGGDWSQSSCEMSRKTSASSKKIRTLQTAPGQRGVSTRLRITINFQGGDCGPSSREMSRKPSASSRKARIQQTAFARGRVSTRLWILYHDLVRWRLASSL